MGDIAICPLTRIVVTWHNVLWLREATHMVVEIIPPLKIIGFCLMEVCACLATISSHVGAIGLLENHILVGGSKRVHSSPRLTL